MNDFLNRYWMDNKVEAYLVVAGVILFALLIKRYVAVYAARLLFLGIKSIWRDVDRKAFTSLVAKPLGLFLVILVAIASLHKLTFPARLNVDVYEITVKQLLHAIGSLLLVISFVRLLIKMIDFTAIILALKANRTHDTADNQLIVFFRDFFKVLILIIGLLLMLKFVLGFDIGNLLTGLSIVGAAIALALRESLENLIASFIIFFDKPFSTGDVVKVQTFTGTVEKIGLRSTRIRTEQKTYITVPNKQMVDTIVDNLSLRTQRKGELRLETATATSAQKIQAVIEKLRQLLDSKTAVESSSVFLTDIVSNAYIIAADYFTGPITMQEFNVLREDINLSTLHLLETLEIKIASNSTDITITTPKSD